MKGLNIGAGISALVLLLILLVKPLFDVFFRDSAAHLFPISAALWAVFKLGVPNTYSYIIIFLLIVLPPLIIAPLVEKLYAQKKKAPAWLLVILVIVLWAWLFYRLSRPMTHGTH